MKPPFDSSGGDTPARVTTPPKPGGGAPGGGVPGMPAGLSDLPEVPDLPTLDDLPACLPGSCDALWNAVDKGLAPVTDAIGSATSAASAVKDTVADTAGAAKDKALGAVQEAKDKAAKTAADAKSAATKAAEDAKAKAAEAVETVKAAMAQKLGEAAAYAQQFLDNPALAWSGLQAVAARQAACAMEEAARAVDKAAEEVNRAADTAMSVPGKAADDAAAYAQARADDARKAADGLKDSVTGAGNADYQTIAPVTQFFGNNGLDKLGECGSIPGRPEVPDAVTQALEQVDKGTAEAVRAGTDLLNQVQQNQVVEQAIYDAERQAREYGAAADKMVSDLRDAVPTEFPLSGTCGGAPSPFDGSMLDPDARARYLNQMADEFGKKGKDEAKRMMDDIIKAAKP